MVSFINMFLVFVTFLQVGSCAKILGIFPVSVRSHRNLYRPLMEKLAERGHEVTVITPFEDVSSSKNGSYKIVLLTGFVEWLEQRKRQLKFLEDVDVTPFKRTQFFVEIMNIISEMTLAHENVQKLIRTEDKFDVMITIEVLHHAYKALGAYFGASVISFSTFPSSSWSNALVGNPAPPSYVPDIFTDYSSQMSFFERLTNSLVFVYINLYFQWYLYPKQNELIQKYIPGNIELDQVLYNVSLVLLNSHPSLNQAVPHVPNMIEIGGFHIKPAKKLPNDLQEFLDSAINGVIYFSLGSNVNSSDLPVEKRNTFLQAFSKLKQKVLWKWERDQLPEQPANVKLGKWLPQQDLLAHPNIKLFITQGGLLSTTETLYHGVPVLVIPTFADQKLNAKIVVNLGFGLSLPFRDVTEETLTQTIAELLTNPKYRNTAKLRSILFHDRIVSPMETAVYWIEYVIRHKGAPHLRVAALDLPWYKYVLLDVVIFLVLIILLILKICYLICKLICCRNKQHGLKIKRD